MQVSNDGGKRGLDYESVAADNARNFTMGFFPNSTRTGRFTFIYWKHQDYHNAGSRTIVQLLGWVMWLRLSRYKIPPALQNMSPSTCRKRLQSPIGLEASIGIGSAKNGLTLKLLKRVILNGKFSYQHTLLMMRCGTGYDLDTDQLIQERER